MSSLTRGKLSTGTDQFSLSLSSGTLSLKDAEGNTISPSNPVKIQLRHTDGTLKTYYITEEFSFRDDANATKSDFLNAGSTDGMEFGLTAATAAASARPMCIGWIHDGTTAIPAMSPLPMRRSTGAATNIGYKEVKPATASDTNIVAWTSSDITTSHANKMFIPFATVTTTMTSAEDHTFALSVTSGDGVGEDALNYNFGTRNFPQSTGQNGAASGRCFLANGGTVPVFTTEQLYYRLTRTGECFVDGYFNGDGGTDGVGAVEAQLALPYKYPTGNVQIIQQHLGYASGATTLTSGADIKGVLTQNTSYIALRYLDAAAVPQIVTYAMFSNGGREMRIKYSYNVRNGA